VPKICARRKWAAAEWVLWVRCTRKILVNDAFHPSGEGLQLLQICQ